MKSPIKITKREKYGIWIASAALGLFVLIQFIVAPIIEKRQQLNRELRTKTQAFQEILVGKRQYEDIRRSADKARKSIAERQRGFTLFSFLDQLAGQTGLKNNIAYMKPSVSNQENSPYKIAMVETKLQGITLGQLRSYIYRIENSDNMVRLKGLSITKTGKQAGYVDAVLLAETLEL